MKTLDLTHTKAVLAEYDAGEQARTDLLRAATTTAEVERWEAEESEALAKLRAAFLEDTKDRNGPSHAKVVDVRYARELVVKYG